jgi:hypothetical protein
MSQCLQTTTACGTSEGYNTTMSVLVGQVVVAQGYCKAIGVTGTGGIRIDWLNSAGTLLSSTTSATTVTGTSSWTLCKVVGTAPASTAYARFAFYTTSCTAGYFQFDDSMMQLQSSSLDEVPQGNTFKSVTAIDPNGKAIIDLSQAHLNKTASNITFASGATIESLKPAAAGADVTANNTAADTAKVNGVVSSSISPIATLMPAQAGADKTSLNTAANTSAVGSNTASDVNNTVLSGGGINFASGLHTNKTLDNIGDGSTYARVNSSALTGNNIDPSKSGMLMKGSLPPVLTNGFTYTSTTSSITWNWPSSMAIYRADGTLTSVGAGSQNISGLVSSMPYYFYPCWNETTQALQWIGNSNVASATMVGYTGNGTTGYVNTATAVSTPTNFSVECWVNTTNTSNSLPLLSLSSPDAIGTATSVVFAMTAQCAGYLATSSSAYEIEYGTLPAGQVLYDGITHHIVFTWNGSTKGYAVYYDGVLVGSGTAASALYSTTGLYWHIGAVQGKASGWLWTTNSYSWASTVLSNAAVYSTVLTTAQVANHYQTMVNLGLTQYNTVVTADAPTYWWKLNETSGTTAADSAGGNTGTYQGGVTLNQTISSFGAVGSPACAWKGTTYLTAQAASVQGMVPLTNGAISATPSGGTGGSGGSGGDGGGGCFSPNTRVRTQRGEVRFDELTLDDSVLTAAGTWRRIAKLLIHDWTSPMLDMGDGELITYKHSVLDGHTWERGCTLFGGSQLYCGQVWNLETDVDEPDEIGQSPYTEHSYTLANGHVVHNGFSTK